MSARQFTDHDLSVHQDLSIHQDLSPVVELGTHTKPDPLDEAVPLTGHAGPEPGEPDHTDEVIDEEERNATGGALPATDDEDNDNDNDDARERAIPDHLVRDEDE